MTSDAFRKLALALPGVEEQAHMHHPDFRVEGRIFATLGYPNTAWAMIRLSPEEQAAFVAMAPNVFVPVKGKWGEQGATSVQLRNAKAPTVRAALEAAHQGRTASRTRSPVRRRRSPK
jgi:hypothetical protein